jgi:4-hydroxy-3-polyprenylbenzoate decarboxylase
MLIEYLCHSKKVEMPYSGLNNFVNELAKNDELHRVNVFVDPVLEITEVTDRLTKSNGKALLFENTGTTFPVLINAYGSDRRMALAISQSKLDEAGYDLAKILDRMPSGESSVIRKIASLPAFLRLAGFLPSRRRRKGICQQVIHMEPDMGILPVLKCWPHDGGRFITLPMVHTVHPVTGKMNVGMYRMQIIDKKTTALHWQRHKTGASHFEAWKELGKRMPVSVALGGDPVYAYAATAPLPENINEYILAGYLRKKKVKLVRCITNDLYVPYDADIIIEGYVDTSEDLAWEGPFGDHTGFYSLADWYPKFHITCITHKKKAIYPATIVGIPPQEDVWIAKATERIFLSPVRMTLQPEIEDFHMPDAGVAHNLVIVKIRKTYPGQGMKVIHSLLGAGQMMFTKYIVVVNGDINIREYKELLVHIFSNIDPGKDIIFSKGPLDVLDHSSDNFSFGGKAGIDATIKHKEEYSGRTVGEVDRTTVLKIKNNFFNRSIIKEFDLLLFEEDIPIIIVAVDRVNDPDVIDKVKNFFRENDPEGLFRLILAVDYTVDPGDYHMVAWQILANTDPLRDHEYITPSSLFIDGTIKKYRKEGFPRKWPNVVCSDANTISVIDEKWESLGVGGFIESPSKKYMKLSREGTDEIIIDGV